MRIPTILRRFTMAASLAAVVGLVTGCGALGDDSEAKPSATPKRDYVAEAHGLCRPGEQLVQMDVRYMFKYADGSTSTPEFTEAPGAKLLVLAPIEYIGSPTPTPTPTTSPSAASEPIDYIDFRYELADGVIITRVYVKTTHGGRSLETQLVGPKGTIRYWWREFASGSYDRFDYVTACLRRPGLPAPSAS